MADEFEVVCIGAGTVSEAVAAQLEGTGISFAVVERELVGGECPYWGCIPSKVLLRSATVLAEAGRARALAASSVEWQVDFAKIAERTNKISAYTDDARAASSLAEKGATLIRGEAHLTGPTTVTVGERRLTASRGIVIGTGTAAAVPPIPGLDEVPYWTNREAVLIRELPASLLVLGSGPIGVELAQAFAQFGSKVRVIESLDRLIPGEEAAAGDELAKAFGADGIAVSTSTTVVAAEATAGGITLRAESGEEFTAEKLLVAVGRKPKLYGFDLEAAGVRTTDRGWIAVDDATLVAAPGIWAGGDITGIGAFTHLSWYHGQVIGRQLKGEHAVADHRAIPRVTYTDPEIASVGMSEQQARDRLAEVRVATADTGNGTRGYINGPPGGVIKLVADMRKRLLVGALVVSPRAGEIISELTLAIRAEVPLEVLVDTLHPFPAFTRDLDGLFPELATG
ncbi:MAG: NAD(P)/FAD-dependent oxidoreductase [Candidatus Dormibacteraeota bacterium]|uniref:NAD(P)/FAD-dependent oxidoreductase n=1 Tax=Candidatus Amunia macphersoniae TaxID=3127014 RepID=A0A934KEC6_9BACT|nr:NAD(P)/FAD-dependent oxidoreductase [Candidatus Dormibacteraeota bacterium]